MVRQDRIWLQNGPDGFGYKNGIAPLRLHK
jgi:hypothetical protein